MEDSHIAATGLDNNVSVFGVFDGHGGMKFHPIKDNPPHNFKSLMYSLFRSGSSPLCEGSVCRFVEEVTLF